MTISAPLTKYGDVTETTPGTYGILATSSFSNYVATGTSVTQTPVNATENDALCEVVTLDTRLDSQINIQFMNPANGNDMAGIRIANGDIRWVQDQSQLARTAYDATAMKWVRVGHRGTDTVWWTSPDGITWTERHRAPVSFPYASCDFRIFAYCPTASTTDRYVIRNVNNPPSAPPDHGAGRYLGTKAVVGEYLGLTRVWGQGSDIVWGHNFDGTTLDTTVWNAIDTAGTSSNNELQDYAPANLTVSGGNLVITARKETRNGKTYTSGKVTSKDKIWIGPYGSIRARISLPSGTGLWPAFWLLGSEANDEWWPECGEIDVMESVNGMTWLQGTVHGGDGRKPPSYVSGDESHWQVFRGQTVPTLAGGFHEYRVDWTQDRVEWFLDDVSYGVATPADMPVDDPPKTWPFNGKQMYLLLNLAVGGNMLGTPIGPGQVDETKLPAQMLVDWVRVSTTSESPTPADTNPPTVPTAWVQSVVKTSTDFGTVNIAWSPSTDNVGVSGYRIYRRAGTTGALDLIDTVTSGTAYADTDQAVGTWQYAVRAFDAAGNVSASSNVVSAVVTQPSTELIANATGDADTAPWVALANTTLTRVTSPTHAGAGAFCMTATAAGDVKVMSEPFDVDITKLYTARAYARAMTVGRSTGLQLEWYSDPGAAPATYISSAQHYATSTTAYADRTVTDALPPANAVAARIVMVVLGCAAGEQHLFDTLTARVTGNAPVAGNTLLMLDGSGSVATYTYSNTKDDPNADWFMENNGTSITRTGSIYQKTGTSDFRMWTQQNYGGPTQPRIRIRTRVRVTSIASQSGSSIVKGLKMMVKSVHPEHPGGINDPDNARGIYPWNIGPGGKSVTPGSMYAFALTSGHMELSKRHYGTADYEHWSSRTTGFNVNQWYDLTFEFEWLTSPNRLRLTHLRDGVQMMTYTDSGQTGKGNYDGGKAFWQKVFCGIRADGAAFEVDWYTIETF